MCCKQGLKKRATLNTQWACGQSGYCKLFKYSFSSCWILYILSNGPLTEGNGVKGIANIQQEVGGQEFAVVTCLKEQVMGLWGTFALYNKQPGLALCHIVAILFTRKLSAVLTYCSAYASLWGKRVAWHSLMLQVCHSYCSTCMQPKKKK